MLDNDRDDRVRGSTNAPTSEGASWEAMAILAQHERRLRNRIRLQHEARLQRERDFLVFALALEEVSRMRATALWALNLTLRELDLTLKVAALELSEQLRRKRRSNGATPASGRKAKGTGPTRAGRRVRAAVSSETSRADSCAPGAK